MTRSLTRWLLVRTALLLPVMTLTGCAVPQVELFAQPGALTIVAGDRGTVTVTIDQAECGTYPFPCLAAQLDFVVQNLPDGISQRVDTSLHTLGLIQIAFEVAANVEPARYEAVIHAMLADRSLGHRPLFLRVLPPGETRGPGAMTISASGARSMAVLTGGAVQAWGTSNVPYVSTEPTAVPGLTQIVTVVSNGDWDGHSLALANDGRVWSWGSNSRGQLGTGDFGREHSPVQVQGLGGVQAIAAGRIHSVALKTDGTVWAWGAASPGPTEGSLVPVRVQNLPAVKAIAASEDYSLAVAVEGTVWIWGNEVVGEYGNSPVSDLPSQVAGLSHIRTVVTSNGTSLALDDDGHVWGWGTNESGNLGDGTRVGRPTPVQIQGLEDVTAIAIGRHHGVALSGDGGVWEWGTQGLTSGTGNRLVPHRVGTGLPTDIVAIAAGDAHTLALSSCSPNYVLAWGDNSLGQLGDGSTTDRSQPIVVARIGTDGCAPSTTLRVSLAGDSGPVDGIVTSDPDGLQFDDSDYVVTFDRGTWVSLTARADFTADGESFTFESWAVDCAGSELHITIVLDRTKHCAARYRNVSAPELLTVIRDADGFITSTGGGILGPDAIACGETCQAAFRRTTIVTLTAHPANGFKFTGWTLECTGTSPETIVTMDDNKTCGATFRPFELVISVGGSGSVTSDPAGLDCADTCTFIPRVGAVALMATPAVGWRFDAWSGDCTGAAPEAVLVMDADKHCTATFARTPGSFLLTMVVQGQGSVTSQPAGIACPASCVAAFPAGSAIGLTAQAGAGWAVSFWFDDCANGVFGTLTNTVTMDSDKQCRIRFTGQPRVPVAAFSFTPPIPRSVGQVVTFDANASHVFDPVTGTADPADIRSFAWDFDGDGIVDVSGIRTAAAVTQHAFQTSGDHPVRLRVRGGPFDDFDDQEHPVLVDPPREPLFSLVVDKAGTGHGSITTNPPGLIRCDTSCMSAGPLLLLSGTMVTLTASAEVGSSFAGWSGAGCTDANASIQVTMTAARTCTATFVGHQFTLAVNNGGNGVVTSDVAGITCGSDCDELYDNGRLLVLTATPSAGFEVSAWTGCDAVSGNVCTVAMDANRDVGVAFSPLSGPFTLTVVVNEPAGSIGRVFGVQPPTSAIDCRDASGPVCAETFPAGSVVVVRPSDSSIELGLFSGWSGCDSVGGLFACTVNMTSHRTIVATFSQ